MPRAISNDLDARDELGHATTHQTWQSVLAVLVTFRARLHRHVPPLPLRERRDGQQPVGEHPDEHDRHRDQGTRNRATNKWTREVHPGRISAEGAARTGVGARRERTRWARRSKNR